MRLECMSGSNGKARILRTAGASLYFSYETLIAIKVTCLRDSSMVIKARRENTWGVTTGKHMGLMGVLDFPVMPDAYFGLLERSIALLINNTFFAPEGV